MERCSPDDPGRCKHSKLNKQCEYLSDTGSDYCPSHSVGPKKENDRRRYILDRAIIKDAYERQSKEVDYLSLKEEIILLHSLLQTRIDTLESQAHVVSATNDILQIQRQLESMKKTFFQMQKSLGLVLSREAVLEIARETAIAIDEELGDFPGKEEIIDKICTRICDTIERVGQQEEDF